MHDRGAFLFWGFFDLGGLTSIWILVACTSVDKLNEVVWYLRFVPSTLAAVVGHAGSCTWVNLNLSSKESTRAQGEVKLT